MARKSGGRPPQAIRNRAAKTAAAMASPSAVAQAQPKKKVSLAQFAREVRAEARRITWTTRRETWITSVMVGIMVVLAALFFMVVDWAISNAVTWILKLASAG
jgi:preprotein translocase subunit SecE